MNMLSAFADEISAELEEQTATLVANGVDNIELRGVWGKNVLELSEDEIRRIQAAASASGLGFSSIGSPLGKFPLDGDFQEQLDGLKRALDYAGILGAPYIRLFSFYIPEGADPASCRDQVLDWLGRLIAEAEKTDIVLGHENEAGIYGDKAERCLDLLTSLRSESFTGIFDPANFVVGGQRPYDDCWSLLKAHTTYFHIKDARLDGGQITPAGQGDGDIPRILADAYADGFDNYLTLEPHLSVAAANYGRTSPDLFKTAAAALKGILAGIPGSGF